MGMHVSVKRLQIGKANSTIVIAVGIAAFALAFSLVAARSLIAKQSYQNKVAGAREDARDQLTANIAAVSDLKTKYSEFVDRQENIIKGNSQGNGERDGDNGRIVLDALPSKYDFPALASSLEKILVDRNYGITRITGTDNEVSENGVTEDAHGDAAAPAEGADNNGGFTEEEAAKIRAQLGGVSEDGSVSGQAKEMPFELGATGAYKNMIELLGVFESSIRPIYIDNITISAGDGTVIELGVQGKSYYQPERTLNVTEEVVE